MAFVEGRCEGEFETSPQAGVALAKPAFELFGASGSYFVV